METSATTPALVPRWKPDSFPLNRGDSEKPSQVYLIPFGGREAPPLTDLPAEILDFAWSPGREKAGMQRAQARCGAPARQNDEQKKKLGVVARHYSRLFYKLDGYGYLPHERTHLWVVDSRTGKARQSTEHALYDEQQPAWSPDGRWIAFVSNRSPNPDYNLYAQDIDLLPAAGGEMRKIEAPLGEKLPPHSRPTGAGSPIMRMRPITRSIRTWGFGSSLRWQPATLQPDREI